MSRTPFRLLAPALLCLSVFAALSIRDLLALLTKRWGLGTRGRVALSVCIVLAVTAERASYAPSAYVPLASAFSSQLAHDPGEYAIAYYPPATDTQLLEIPMWDQVAHRKRILVGALARMPVGPTLDPGKRPLLKTDRQSPEQTVEALRQVFLVPRYDIKFLVVRRGADRGQAEEHTRLRRLLTEHYPRVAQESPQLPQLGRRLNPLLERDVYYVGGELFRRDLTRLLRDAEKLRARICSRDDAELQLEKQRLRDAWTAFRKTSAQRERDETEFSTVQDLIAFIDSPRCPGEKRS